MRSSPFYSIPKILMLCSGPDTPLKALLPVRLGTSAPPSNTWFPSLTRLNVPNSISIGSAVFAELTAERPYMGHPFPSKLAPFYGEIWTASNTWFLGPIRALNTNGISIGSAVFAQLTAVSLYFTMGRPFPSKLPLPVGICTPSNLIHGSFGHPSPQPKGHLDRSKPFLQGCCDRPRYSVGNNMVASTLCLKKRPTFGVLQRSHTWTYFDVFWQKYYP